jgi:hypothetical protein
MSVEPAQTDAELFVGYVVGVKVYDWLNTQTNWKNAWDLASFDIILQGSQIGGPYIGHPDDPLGYSRNRNGGGVTGGEVGGCIVGGTAPNSCTTTVAGQTTIAPVFPSTFEVDYVRVWGYTG